MERKTRGDLGEKLAKDFLKKKGYRVLETNYRCPEGEIDIVARHKDHLVFIEVRTKSGFSFGTPEESITPAKMRHLTLSADHYLQNHDKLPELWRIDLVAVVLDKEDKLQRIDLIENAIEE